jgi:hypothetical protein
MNVLREFVSAILTLTYTEEYPTVALGILIALGLIEVLCLILNEELSKQWIIVLYSALEIIGFTSTLFSFLNYLLFGGERDYFISLFVVTLASVMLDHKEAENTYYTFQQCGEEHRKMC